MTAADLADRLHRSLGVSLNGFDLPADILGRLGGLLGQFLHLVGHHRKALARFAGSGRLDGGIQGQQVGLLRNGGDDLDHLPDLGARFAQLGHRGVGGFGGLHRGRRHPGGFVGVLGDLLDAEELISSVAVATVCRFLVTCSAAAETTLDWVAVSSALALIWWLTALSSSDELAKRLRVLADLGHAGRELVRHGIDIVLDSRIVALVVALDASRQIPSAIFCSTFPASCTGATKASSVSFTPCTTLRYSP